jgi:hypothetical protein
MRFFKEQSSKSISRNDVLQILALLAMIVFVYLRPGFYSSNIFIERDLTRAVAWSHWQGELNGPELSGGGRLPGPFLYLLLAFPLFFSPTWTAAVSLLVSLLVASIGAACFFLTKRFSIRIALLFAILAASNGLIQNDIFLFWSASFIFPFATFIMILGFRCFETPAMPNRWLFLGALLACCLQIHATFIFLYAACVALLFVSAHKLPQKDRRKIIGAFLLGSILPLLPAMISAASGSSRVTMGFVGSFRGIPDYILSLLRYPRGLNTNKAIIVSFLPSLFLLLPALNSGKPHTTLLRPAITYVLFLLPPALLLFFSSYGTRYGVCFETAYIFFVALALARSAESPWILCLALSSILFVFLTHYAPALGFGVWAMVGSLFILSLASLAAWRRSENDPINFRISSAVATLLICMSSQFATKSVPRHPQYAEISNVLAAIQQQTGWTDEEFRWRTILVNGYGEDGFHWSFPVSGLGKAPGKKVPDLPRGYLLFRLFVDGSNSFLQAPNMERQVRSLLSLNPDFRAWEPSFRFDMAHALCSPKKTLCAIPYFGPASIPVLLQNIGTSYLHEKYPFSTEFEALHGADGEKKWIAPGRALFSWNPCATTEFDCRTGIGVALKRENNFVTLTATAMGTPISLPTRDLNPRWSENWRDPFVSWTCNGISETHLLSKGIGIAMDINKQGGYVRGPLAPLQSRFKFLCPPGALTSIAAGRNESQVWMIRRMNAFRVLRPEKAELRAPNF